MRGMRRSLCIRCRCCPFLRFGGIRRGRPRPRISKFLNENIAKFLAGEPVSGEGRSWFLNQVGSFETSALQKLLKDDSFVVFDVFCAEEQGGGAFGDGLLQESQLRAVMFQFGSISCFKLGHFPGS